MTPFLNSFQRWAADYAAVFGFTMTPAANWVELHRDGETIACMSVAGVLTLCQSAAK